MCLANLSLSKLRLSRITSIRQWVVAKENIYFLPSKNSSCTSLSEVTNFWNQIGVVLSNDRLKQIYGIYIYIYITQRWGHLIWRHLSDIIWWHLRHIPPDIISFVCIFNRANIVRKFYIVHSGWWEYLHLMTGNALQIFPSHNQDLLD